MASIKEIYSLFLNSTGISTDTRTIRPGNLFFALRGPNFDANKFAADALKKGAIAAVVDDPTTDSDSGFIHVANAKTTLQKLATYHRNTFDIPVLCITGSNGKTTTKELVKVVLSRKYNVHATLGNFNNLIGLPLTMLAIKRETEFAILEIGTSGPGEIEKLSAIANPTHGLITNIGAAHLEKLIDLDGVAHEKGALFRFLAKHNGTAFVNLDEKYLQDLAGPVKDKVYFYESEMGDPADNKFSLGNTSLSPLIRYFFYVDHVKYEGASQLFGIHNFRNISAAVAIGRYFGVKADEIVDAIAGYVPGNNRSQVLNLGSNKIILDAYNSNPTSVRAVLDLLHSWSSEKQKLVILGDMLELGENSRKEHEAILEKLAGMGSVRAILVGKEFHSLGQSGFPSYETVEDLKQKFALSSLNDSLILIKGSRGIRLEELLK
jgi:UDP-N-acetylmuramoyl-tripeptide--D-alanyl-D-alanine ligase